MNAYPTAPPVYPGFMRKPTDVMGRRIGAYLLDSLIGIVIVGGLTFAVMAGVKPVDHLVLPTTSSASDFCTNYTDDVVGTVAHEVRNRYGNRACVSSGRDVYLIKLAPVVGTAIGFSLLWGLINFVVIEGSAGGSVGKLIVAIRVARSDGQIAGLGRAFGRNAVLQVPSAIPFFGLLWTIAMLIMTLAKDDHRHLGDLAGGTYVVDKHAIGQPVAPAPAGFGPPGTGGFPPPPSQAGWGSPTGTGFGPPTSSPPTSPPPGSFGPAPAPTQAPAAAPVAAQPQWDQARNTYIWWNADEQRWLEHDQASGEWRPISQ